MLLPTVRRWRPVDNSTAPLPLAGRALPLFARLEYSHVVRFSVFRGIYKTWLGKRSVGRSPLAGWCA